MQSTPGQYSSNLYEDLLKFTEAHPRMNYAEFDSFILKEISLFDVPDDEFLANTEKVVDKIIAALPSLKRIFARPIIRLTDVDQIVSIEAVKVVDNRSIVHAAAHSELWDDISKDYIKPRKLMTIDYSESYSIYENIAFAYAIDTILAFIKQALVRLKDILYGCRDMYFNLLDRTHHNLYFLAIGKLHLEYVHARLSHPSFIRCVEKLLFVDKVLRAKLSSPVYVNCKKK